MATLKYGAIELVPSPLLSLAIEGRFFGNESSYSRSKRYVLNGTILDQVDLVGISGIATRQNDIITGFSIDFNPLMIDGVLVGYPRVLSTSFENGSWVQKNVYKIELEILDSGNPKITGYANIPADLFGHTSDITENFSYSFDGTERSCAHSIQVQGQTGYGYDSLVSAKIIASGLLESVWGDPAINGQSAYASKTYEERMDVENGNYSIVENLLWSTGIYSHNYTLSLRQSDGITSVEQRGKIIGYTDTKYQAALSGYNEISPLIYSNCNGIYSNYGCPAVLNTTWITNGKSENVNEGIIDYSRTFTDESGVGPYKWQYGFTYRLVDSHVEAAEDGSIVGMGAISSRMSVVNNAWKEIESGIPLRIVENKPSWVTGVFFPTSRRQNMDEFAGSISYEYAFSDCLKYSGSSEVRLKEINITDSPPRENKVTFRVPFLGVIQQDIYALTFGERRVALKVEGFRESTISGLKDEAKTLFNTYRPTGTDSYINSVSVRSSPLLKNIDAEASWLYTR